MLSRFTKKIINKGRDHMLDLQYASGVREHQVPSNSQMILCYHGIDTKGSTRFNSKFISLKNLDAQFRYFRDNFNVVPLDEFMAAKDSPKSKFTMAITFDDGYRNNYKYVLPLINKYAIPVTFFITGISSSDQSALCADLLDLASDATNAPLIVASERYRKNYRNIYLRARDGVPLKKIFHASGYEFKRKVLSSFPSDVFDFKKQTSLKDYWEQMTIQEIEEISKSEHVTIGSHSFYHDDLTLMSVEDAKQDILKSRAYLENIIQKEVLDFAFPYGRYTDSLLETCIEVGLRSALPLDYLTERRNAIIHDRFGINPYIRWNAQLHYILQGSYD